MNSIDVRATQSLAPQARPRLYWTLADALVLAQRHLVQIPRIPEELIFATIQPIMFVLLFRYVFGGAIAITGTSYVNYLMAGIFAQTVIFGATTTGIGLATDLQRGLVDRFRSLPMAKSAVLTGRTIADIVRNTFIVFVMWTVGLLVDLSDDRVSCEKRGGGTIGRLHLAFPINLRQQCVCADTKYAWLAARL